MKRKSIHFVIMAFVLVIVGCKGVDKQNDLAPNKEWEGRIYPSEHVVLDDTTSGAKLIYVTTNNSNDVNLYFDYNCWFKDLSAMFFISNRNGANELFAY
ncbi:MAG: hypothetical protein KAI45_09935, partial [Melioribacteraceae bacterium]|nr:hypothetical protein [Melioribacteraceae bacterium]